MTTRCFELNFKLQTVWYTAKIFTDDPKKVKINKKLKYEDVNSYVKKIHRICLN